MSISFIVAILLGSSLPGRHGLCVPLLLLLLVLLRLSLRELGEGVLARGKEGVGQVVRAKPLPSTCEGRPEPRERHAGWVVRLVRRGEVGEMKSREGREKFECDEPLVEQVALFSFFVHFPNPTYTD